MLPSAGLALAASPWKTVRMADVGLGLTQSSRSWLNQRIRDVPTPASHPQGRRTGPQEVHLLVLTRAWDSSHNFRFDSTVILSSEDFKEA